MGLDPDRFPNAVDEELICPICSWVFADPVQTSSCEHSFCRTCIEEWLKQRLTCPVDRQPISVQNLVPAPRILRNLLARQFVECENKRFGCTALVRLDGLERHAQLCDCNPNKLTNCKKGCGAAIPKDKLHEHNCLLELRCLLDSYENRLEANQRLISDQVDIMNSHERKIKDLEERVQGLLNIVKTLLNDSSQELSIPNFIPGVAGTDLSEDSQDLQIWASSLPEATVTRWGGMISTPDSVLQAGIKRALLECGCPSRYADALLDRAHERRWPPGLSSLETRQVNRRQYDSYVCRRVPGKQAVLILALNNGHMPSDMTASPGLVMVFAHGVESN